MGIGNKKSQTFSSMGYLQISWVKGLKPQKGGGVKEQQQKNEDVWYGERRQPFCRLLWWINEYINICVNSEEGNVVSPLELFPRGRYPPHFEEHKPIYTSALERRFSRYTID